MAIYDHLFKRKALPPHSRRRESFWRLIGELYPLQKLRVIRSYKKVPRRIRDIVAATNDLRNTAAHEFALGFSGQRKFRYRGTSLLTPSGLGLFIEDVQVVEDYFAPWLGKIVAKLGY